MTDIVFRADASSQIGVGHVVRCLTLAKHLPSSFGIKFACDPLPGNMIAEIKMAGFDVCDPASLRSTQIDWLIVDHYGLDREYEKSMRGAAKKICVIDDLARPHDCELLLDQNFYHDMENRYNDLVPKTARVLTGPKYALLRAEFVAARALVHRTSSLQRIFVFFGGADATNETLKVLRALDELQLDTVNIDVLLGGSNPHWQEVNSYAVGMERVRLIRGTDRISQLMLQTDLAIGGGGTTTWERCCLGLPSVAIAVADNQVAICQAMADAGYLQYLGRFNYVTEATIIAAVERCIAHFPEVLAQGLEGMTLVDGLGTERVAHELRMQ